MQNPGNRAALAAQGAVNALVGALQSHPQHAGLQGAVRSRSETLPGISACDVKFYVWAVWWQGCAALASLAVDDAVAQQVAALGGSAIVMAVRHHIDDFGLALALT